VETKTFQCIVFNYSLRTVKFRLICASLILSVRRRRARLLRHNSTVCDIVFHSGFFGIMF